MSVPSFKFIKLETVDKIHFFGAKQTNIHKFLPADKNKTILNKQVFLYTNIPQKISDT
jgi:hypothetical protein